ncbi:MAG: methyltransferase domain-containing protein [Gammaproteobacteria bacterium]|nr:methyltransferase domain-containing protein [Gammaproteobacteria bacterium]
MEKTTQTEAWSGDFGDSYTSRNPHTADDMDALYRKNFGLTRSELNREFIGDMDRASRILEVGTNTGAQLQLLQNMGFRNLRGIDVQARALETARQLMPGIELTLAEASDIPFGDGFFDMVFTSGVLIHISPDNIVPAIREIHRCSGRYIWGYEYFSADCTPIRYRGRDNLMWKANFPKLYLDEFADLKLIRERKIRYRDSDNRDIMFLLEKTGAAGR